jgi:predicted TIM-barrel fold metal-dependent hydrolase
MSASPCHRPYLSIPHRAHKIERAAPDDTRRGSSERGAISRRIERFGPERAIIAATVPPDALAKSFGEIYEAFHRLTASFSKGECHRLFGDTAAGI